MSLSSTSGPLGSKPAGDFNLSLDDAPAHRLYFDPFPRRVRALIGDRVVLDSLGARVLYESNLKPQLYVPLADFDGLERTETSTYCPFKGDASYFSLAGVEDAVWTYENPIDAAAWLKGYGCLYWEKADAWFIEDERVFAHLKDPYHRVDVYEASRPARVTAGGALIAETERAKILYETGLAPRVYVPGADVVTGVLRPNPKRTVCPYKGEASYWDVAGVEGGAWSYEAPLPEAFAIRGHLSFEGEGIEVELAEPAERFTLGAAA